MCAIQIWYGSVPLDLIDRAPQSLDNRRVVGCGPKENRKLRIIVSGARAVRWAIGRRYVEARNSLDGNALPVSVRDHAEYRKSAECCEISLRPIQICARSSAQNRFNVRPNR